MNDSSESIPPIPRRRAREPGGRTGCLWGLTMGLVSPIASAFATVLLFVAVFAIIGARKGGTDAGVDDVPSLRAVWSYGSGDVSVVRIPVRGVLVSSEEDAGWFSEEGPVEKALRQIRAATKDPEIKGLILEIDSPGGSITASDLLHRAVMDFKAEQAGRQVIAIMGDLAASGGYYVAVAADYIIAHPTTLTGSIGVMISKLNIKGLGDEYGVRMETVKSGENKNLLSPFEDLTESQRAMLQEMVDEMYERFVELIVNGRPGLTVEEVKEIADGCVLSASKALDCRLIDEIGYWDDAVARLCGMLDVENVKVLRYDHELGLSSLLKSFARPGLDLRIDGHQVQSRLMYLWQVR